MGLAAVIQLDERLGERRDVAIPGTIRKSAAPIDVEIENLSISGFRATLDAELQLDDVVSIGAAWMGCREARVVWAEHPSYGFSFENLLTEAEVASAQSLDNVETIGQTTARTSPAFDPDAAPARFGIVKSLTLATASTFGAIGTGLLAKRK